jgi:fibronectin type 3 domain-containing protein
VRGAAYIYRVASVGLSGERGTFSLPASVYGRPVAGGPSSIDDLRLKNMASSVRVSWPEVEATGVAGYRVLRRAPSQATFVTVGTVESGTFEYDDRSVKPGNTYVYTVLAVDRNQQTSPIRTTRSIYREPSR